MQISENEVLEKQSEEKSVIWVWTYFLTSTSGKSHGTEDNSPQPVQNCLLKPNAYRNFCLLLGGIKKHLVLFWQLKHFICEYPAVIPQWFSAQGNDIGWFHKNYGDKWLAFTSHTRWETEMVRSKSQKLWKLRVDCKKTTKPGRQSVLPL